MARIEKTVFISYRRTDVYTALAVYENLKNQGYDVFFDYTSVSSGDFEQIITSNIRARAHFLIILTPTALDRCSEPGDWVRREIEIAIEEKRNIVPLLFKGFRFGTPNVSESLTGKLKNLSRYNGLNVHEDYFGEAMQRLRTQFLNIPLDTVLHPVSTEVQKVVREEQVAADKALQQENVKEIVRQAEEKPNKPTAEPESKPVESVSVESLPDKSFTSIPKEIKPVRRSKLPKPFVEQFKKYEAEQLQLKKKTSWRLIAGLTGGLVLLALCIWGAVSLWNNLPNSTPESTRTSKPVATGTSKPAITNTPLSTETTLGIGSTMTGKDGMTLLYVPAGEFTMGSDAYYKNEKPVHTVYLDAFWIDQTEVTNAMYVRCAEAGICNPPISTRSLTRGEYYGNPDFDNYPLIFADWNMAKAYCNWVERRLPTEAEWEKAARGPDGYVYPWGNESPAYNSSNYNDRLGDTTEVDGFPQGKSFYGALNMAGNVWEWVNSLYGPYPYDVTDGRESLISSDTRVLRGGSYLSSADFIRSTARIRGDSTYISYDGFGFRCAMDATP